MNLSYESFLKYLVVLKKFYESLNETDSEKFSPIAELKVINAVIEYEVTESIKIRYWIQFSNKKGISMKMSLVWQFDTQTFY